MTGIQAPVVLPSPCSSISPSQAQELQAPSRPGWKGFLHQLLTDNTATAYNSLHSREHTHRHVGSSQGPNSKCPATWARVSKAKLSGIASSVHTGGGGGDGKGMSPPAPRGGFVPHWHIWEATARTGRQTGLPSDCTQPGYQPPPPVRHHQLLHLLPQLQIGQSSPSPTHHY